MKLIARTYPRRPLHVIVDNVRAGGKVVRQGHAAVWGGYTGAFADPDGYVWEVAHNPGWELMEDGTVCLP